MEFYTISIFLLITGTASLAVSVPLVPAVVGTVPYLIFPKLKNALDLQWRLYLHHKYILLAGCG